MQKNKMLFSIFVISMLALPSYADGGIPLWIWSAQNAFSTCAIDILGGPVSALFFGLIVLFFVILIELSIFCFIDKKKQINLSKKIKVISLSNIYSTIAGFLITFPLVYLTLIIGGSDSEIGVAIMGPGYGILTIPLHIGCFILSYFIELLTMKKLLSNEIDISVIKKTALWANIWTYFILNPFTIIVLFAILGLFIK